MFLQCVSKDSEQLYNYSNWIRKFVLYSTKISLNIQKCFIAFKNSFRFFSTVFDLWYKNSGKETERIVKGQKTFGNIREYFVRVQYINVFELFVDLKNGFYTCLEHVHSLHSQHWMRLFLWFSNIMNFT